ncbi:hypothetical protein FW800_24705 [Pseudomonas sp. 910_23]
MALGQPQARRLVRRGQPAAFDAADPTARLTCIPTPCGSGLARDCGVSFSTSASEPPLSRASPLPQGTVVVSRKVAILKANCAPAC